MISEKLEARVIYKRKHDKKFDPEVKAIIDKAVRKLVLVMRGLEVGGTMKREDIEDCVIRSFEQAEYLYYALDEHELLNVMEREIANEQFRNSRRHQ